MECNEIIEWLEHMDYYYLKRRQSLILISLDSSWVQVHLLLLSIESRI